MHYAMIEERLVESLRKWEDAKRTKLEYYIANVNPEYWSEYKARTHIDHIQPYLITNMSSNATSSNPTLLILIVFNIIMVSKCNKFEGM